MYLNNLLDYGNSIYDLRGKFNSLKRENKNAKATPATCIKMFMMGFLSNRASINNLEQSIFATERNKLKGVFSKDEFIPKTHAFRDCINDINYEQVANIHYEMLDILKKNKFFENHTYRGSRVAIVDGVESFETHKNIDGLHIRNHKNEITGYYYKSLGIMYLSDNTEIMLDLVPFEKHEVLEDNDHNKKIKSEGEITVLKRILPNLKKFKIDVAVMDCMFANAPCLNEIKANEMEAIIKFTDERRCVYKDAEGLFSSQNPVKTYEIVEVNELKKVKYSKLSKKKNKTEINDYEYCREQTSLKLGTKIVEEKTTTHPKKEITKKVSEKIVKKVKIYSDLFELKDYNYGKIRILKVVETKIEHGKEVEKEMYIITTMIDEDLEFITDLMHRRWNIELKGFRKLKTRYNMKHLFIGTNNAIRLIHYLIMIVFNLIELYFNVHTKKHKNINFNTLLENYMFDMATEDIYNYFLSTS